jgi:formylglycine-generating enzyme required for sulfatase activity
VVNCTGPGIHAGYPSTVKDNHQSGNGDDMLPVEAGAFAYQDALSATTWVNVPDFYIAKYETTNTEYCRFLNEMDSEGQYYDSNMEITQSGTPGQYTYAVQSGKERYPIRYASFYEAQAYGNWKSRVTGLPYRLPTEEEWEKAAGWDPVQKKLWTYGFQQHTINDTWCNYNFAYIGPIPVGTFNGTDGKNDAFSYYGCYDMTGNVWEWTSSVQSTSRVVRGGGYFNPDTVCTVTYRSGGTPAGRPYGVGFRLARDCE